MKTNLKRATPVIIGGLLLIAIFFGGSSLADNRIDLVRPTKAENPASDLAEPQFNCSNATLSGQYAATGIGFVPGGQPASPLIPFGNLGLMTMDGAGNLTNKVTVSRNGQIIRNLDSGTYTVNPDCTGNLTINVPDLPYQLKFDLVVSDLQGPFAREFYFIATSPGVVTHTAKRFR
jgi:hypothetical protein